MANRGQEATQLAMLRTFEMMLQTPASVTWQGCAPLLERCLSVDERPSSARLGQGRMVKSTWERSIQEMQAESFARQELHIGAPPPATLQFGARFVAILMDATDVNRMPHDLLTEG